MFCAKCGTNNEGTNFCVGCGAPLMQQAGAQSGIPAGTRTPKIPSSMSKGLPVEGGKGLWFIFFLIWVGLIALNKFIGFCYSVGAIMETMRWGGTVSIPSVFDVIFDLAIIGGLVFVIVALAAKMSCRYLVAEIVLMSIFGITLISNLLSGMDVLSFVRYTLTHESVGLLFGWFYIKSSR